MHDQPFRTIHTGGAVPGPYGPYRLALSPDAMHRHLAAARQTRARVTAALLQAALEALRRGIREAAAAALHHYPPRPAPR